jgi:hypothetical protein
METVLKKINDSKRIPGFHGGRGFGVVCRWRRFWQFMDKGDAEWATSCARWECI